LLKISDFFLLSFVSPPDNTQNVLGILKNTDISRKNAKDNSEKPSENHINNIISEGFENKNSKPFWNYDFAVYIVVMSFAISVMSVLIFSQLALENIYLHIATAV
jgi:hypothetical protein